MIGMEIRKYKITLIVQSPNFWVLDRLKEAIVDRLELNDDEIQTLTVEEIKEKK